MTEFEKGERIAKVIARAGLCSRRDAEAWIATGRVTVDGRVLTSPAATVTAASRIEVDGEPLPAAAAARLFRYHKPRGEITTTRDPQDRTTVFDRLPAELGRLQAVGRLDINSEGLLLLTNDGALKRQLELPSSGWLRRYRVRAHGRVTAERLAALAKGVTVEGVDYGPVEAALDHQTGTNAWLTIGLREGKNREVRKICAHLGLSVNRLIRIAYGPFSLGKLPKRALDEVEPARLRRALGLEDKTKKKQGKGFAKAKAKLNRPGSRRGFKHQREAAARQEAPAKAAPHQETPRQEAPAKATPRQAAPQRTAARKAATKQPSAEQPSAKRPRAKQRAAKQPGTKQPGTKSAPAQKPSGARPSHAHRRRSS